MQITKTEIEQLENKGLKNQDIAKYFGVSCSHIYKLKKKYGLSTKRKSYKYLRKFKVDDNFFTKPNNINCYWAGFIAADGCIQSKNKLILSLSYKDLDQLEKFKQDINSNHNIGIYTTNTSYADNTKYCKIVIYSDQIVLDLLTIFNISTKKTFTLIPPNINDPLLIDYYIKGYIDGDGCISRYKLNKTDRENLDINITGTKTLLDWFNKRFSQITETHCCSLSERTSKNIYRTSYANKIGRQLFLHYYNLDYGFPRKWTQENFDFCINWKRKYQTTSGTVDIETEESYTDNENS